MSLARSSLSKPTARSSITVPNRPFSRNDFVIFYCLFDDNSNYLTFQHFLTVLRTKMSESSRTINHKLNELLSKSEYFRSWSRRKSRMIILEGLDETTRDMRNET